MQPTIHLRDELVPEAHLDADEPHILLRREGEPGAVRPVSPDSAWRRASLTGARARSAANRSGAA
jgi:hypothetical protein